MHITRRADQFHAIWGQILAFEYTELSGCVKEWSDFEEMGGMPVTGGRHPLIFAELACCGDALF